MDEDEDDGERAALRETAARVAELARLARRRLPADGGAASSVLPLWPAHAATSACATPFAVRSFLHALTHALASCGALVADGLERSWPRRCRAAATSAALDDLLQEVHEAIPQHLWAQGADWSALATPPEAALAWLQPSSCSLGLAEAPAGYCRGRGCGGRRRRFGLHCHQ